MVKINNEIHKEKLIIALMSLMILFFCVFTFAYISLKSGHSLFNIGFNYIWENWVVMVLSSLSVIKLIVELLKV